MVLSSSGKGRAGHFALVLAGRAPCVNAPPLGGGRDIANCGCPPRACHRFRQHATRPWSITTIMSIPVRVGTSGGAIIRDGLCRRKTGGYGVHHLTLGLVVERTRPSSHQQRGVV